MIEPCTPEEDAAFGEIIRDNYKLKREIYQKLDGSTSESRKTMRRSKPGHVKRAEREAIDRVVWSKSND